MYPLERLQRYPKAPHLQAYNSADKLLIQRWQELGGRGETTWVVNDDFGAISLSTKAAQSSSDSWLAHRAMLNNGVNPAVLLNAERSPSGNCDIVLLKIPKQEAALKQQLQMLCAAVTAPATVLCAGMDKHLSPNTARWIEQVLGEVTRHPGKSKARVFEARLIPTEEKPDDGAIFTEVPGFNKPLLTLPGNFSSGALDGGTRLILAHLQRVPTVSSACDLACGNGVLGLALLLQGKAQSLCFADESSLAIYSAKRNVAAFFPDQSDMAHFHWGDGLLGLQHKYQLILCNPPFHQGHVMDAAVGKRLLRQCSSYLTANGELWVVANAHLPYAGVLKKHFAHVDVVARNKKYQLWRARSPRVKP